MRSIHERLTVPTMANGNAAGVPSRPGRADQLSSERPVIAAG
jgi:hypothetical protein